MTDGSRSSWYSFQETRIADFPVVTASRAELVRAMLHDCKDRAASPAPRQPRLVFDLNGQGISMTRTDMTYRTAMRQADVIHCDGGIWVQLSRFTGRPIAERSSTTDMMVDFAEACQEHGLSFYILGGTPKANAAFCTYLRKHYPRLEIAGNHHGYFSAEEEEDVIASIDAAKADVVWVGTGKPREQAFSVRLRDAVDAGWIVTCGGCYNYFTGGYSRAPLWMRNSGLEWLHRMATQPSQFAWRYIKTNPHSLCVALWDLAKFKIDGGRIRSESMA